MDTIPAELERRLKKRIARQIEMEAECTDPQILLDFIDPAILLRRAEREDEPAATLDTIKVFLSSIESASLLSAKVVKFATIGGKIYGHRPTAIVEISVEYNDLDKPVQFRGPWILDAGEWYTCALGKSKGFGSE